MKHSIPKKNKVKFLFIALVTLCTLATAQASQHPYLSKHGIVFSSGNKHLSTVDYTLTSVLQSLSLKRYYNSQDPAVGSLGYGWSIGIGRFSKLDFRPGLIFLIEANGRRVTFNPQGTDTWVNNTGKVRTITLTGSIYQLEDSNGSVRLFDASGKITEERDRNGNSISYSYTGDLLTGVSDSFGRQLTLSYTNDLISSITTPSGNFLYSYDANSNLISVLKPDGTTRQYIYDDPLDVHNLTGIIDESDTRIATIGYDDQDRVTSSALADGQESYQIEYLPDLQRKITDSQGVETTYQLALEHGTMRVTSFTGPGCSSCGTESDTQYTYNDRFQVATSIDDNGTVTSYTYDANGNKLTKTRAAGNALERTTTYTYTPENRVDTISVDSIANPGQQSITSMSYDTNGNLLSKTVYGFAGTNPVAATTSYTYNQYGQITSIDGLRTDVNDTITLAYYPNDASQGLNRGYLHTVTNALNHTITYSDYNVHGQAETITNANGVASTRSYNSRGMLTSTATGGITSSYAYNNSGQLTSVTMPGSRVVNYTYTSTGKVEQITDNQGNRINYSYDSEGRKIGEEIHDPADALTRFTNFEYNTSGRLEKVLHPGGAEESLDYDSIGNLITQINATGMQTDLTYDVLNRLLTVTEAGDAAAGYTYDGNDNTTTVTDAADNSTTFTFDDLGRRLTRTAPDTGLTSYQYDEAGNLLTVTDAESRTMTMAYDALNRPVSQSYEGAASGVDYTYDQGPNATGRLSTVDDDEGSRSFEYNSLGQLTSETRTIGGESYTTSYSYSTTTGELESMTYPSGRVLAYTLDSIGRISTVNLDGAPLFSNGSYLPLGPLKSATLGNQISLSRDYDLRYQINRIQGAGLDYGYTRDAGGHVTGITNIQSPETNSEVADYSYLPDSNKLSASTGNTPKTYTYDAVGNMTSDGVFTFTYDGLNRIVQVEKDSAIIATYGYDSQHRRIRKTVGSVTTHYHYDSSNLLIGETLADGTPVRDYFYVNGKPIGVQEYQSNPGVYYIINDHLGTPQQLVDSAGTVAWRAGYLPFGKAQVQVEAVVNNLRFPGQYFDEETGLHYNWHRFYDPETGRYISADPIGLAGGMNLYSYVQGNPINWIDPWGLLGEVITFQPVGWGASSFGHTAYNDNGTVYSFGPNGMWQGSFEDYMKKNDFREAVGAVLNLTPQQEDKLRKCLDKEAGDYGKFTNNCGDPLENCLEELGFDLGANLFPVGLGEALDDGGYVKDYNFYPRNPDLPAPKPGSSAPWAR